jgi:hypothetical protein
MEEHLTINAISTAPSPRPSLWSRLVAIRWPPTRRGAETPASDGSDRASRAGGVVGAKKRAVFVDRRGRLRLIELYLPTDVLADMRQPIEIRFLEGEEAVGSEQMQHGIVCNFQGLQ